MEISVIHAYLYCSGLLYGGRGTLLILLCGMILCAGIYRVITKRNRPTISG